MKLLSSSIAVVLGLSLFLSSQKVFAGSGMEGFQKLTPAEQKTVQDGGQVVQFGSEKPWPSAIVYQRINATPEESVAVFFDYGHQVKYIPHLMTVVPTAVSKTVYDVAYQVKVPFIPSWMGGIENYTVRDELVSFDNGHSYEVKWNLLTGHGETTKSSVGGAKFEDLGGATLLAYSSYIVPGRKGADFGFVVDGAKKSVKEAVASIVKQIEKEKSEDKVLLDNQLQKLKEAFSN
ncbi:MAG: hypothetical protein ABI041_09375 [Bdellovibrionia bacterium]